MNFSGRAALASAVGLAALLTPLSSPSRAATPDPFTVVLIPDPQNYTKTTTNTNTYYKAQTQWIVNNSASLNASGKSKDVKCSVKKSA